MSGLAELTTLRLGGPARELVVAESDEALVDAVRDADGTGVPVLLLAGGSNVVVADAGFDGRCVLVRTRGVEVDGATVTAAAGEDWDALVARCVAAGLAGIECLSGIPGSVGATPVQNVGAYGQEVAQTITLVTAYDRRAREVVRLAPGDCAFGYRTSAFKRDPGRWVVLRVTYRLEASGLSGPIRYGELRTRLGGLERAPLADVRAAVLALRAGKGMVLDPDDPDTRSAGSFFTNPVVSPEDLAEVARRAGAAPPAWPEPDGRVKTSAAWLIERAGFTKGHGDRDGIALSSKHPLALTNRGAGTTAELVALAREVAGGVRERFGVDLVPEPVFVGHAWEQQRNL